MKFRVVRVFDRVTSSTDNVAYRVETQDKMTQVQAVALMEALDSITDPDTFMNVMSIISALKENQ